MRRQLTTLAVLLLLLGGGSVMGHAAAEWVGCKYLTAGTNITITCPDTAGRGGATIDASGGGGTPGGSTTQIQFNSSNAFAGDSNLTWDNTNKNLIVGPGPATISNTAFVLQGDGSTTFAQFLMEGAQETGVIGTFTVNSGTLSSPSASFGEDTALVMRFRGVDASNVRSIFAELDATVDANPSAGRVPGRFAFFTVAGSGATSLLERLRITTVTAFLAGTYATTSPALKGGGAGATLAVRTADDTADAPLSALSVEVTTGGSTTISTGVGSVKMSTANPGTNTAWIPIKYAGNTYFVPGWTTNAP